MYDYATPQQVFDASTNIPASTLRMHFLVDDLQVKHKAHVIEHGMYPMAYWDDIAALASKERVEFVHPKFAVGMKTVEVRPTVH